MTEIRPVRGVLFDVHDTLVIKDYRASQQGLLNSLAVLHSAGYEVTAEQYQAAWRRAGALARKDTETLSEVTVEGWYRSILDGLQLESYPSGLAFKMNGAFSEAFASGTRALPHTKRALRQISKLYRLGIISNSLAPNTLSDLRVTGIQEFFDIIVISSDFGKRKPHRAIFLSALERMGLQPEEAVFVGDNPYEDVFGAGQAGMRTVLIVHPMVQRARRRRPALSAPQQFEFPSQPDACISGLQELGDLLQEWNQVGREALCLER